MGDHFQRNTHIKKKLPDSQVLTPHQNERLTDSAITLNGELQRYLRFEQCSNFDTDTSPSLKVGRHLIRENDPVLVTENSYDLEIFNGTLGKLIEISASETGESIGSFEFEGHSGLISLTLSQCYEVGISLAYAITIHKSQGSEFNVTIISCIVESDFVERSMIYTALTRTKRLCIIVGDRRIYNRAVESLTRSNTLITGFKLVS